MKFVTSLHLETADLVGVERILDPLLKPGTSAFLVAGERWASAFVSSLETHSLVELERLAVPLSERFRLVAIFADGDRMGMVEYRDGKRVSAATGDAKVETRIANLEVPVGLAFTNFDAINELELDGDLGDEFIRLEGEPQKPGLAEFFGRAVDE